MPKYDYQCQMCGAVYEVEHGMGEDVAVVCWHCTNDVICKRVYGAPGIVLRGDGWGRDAR